MLSGITDVLKKSCGTKRPLQSWKDKDLFEACPSSFGNLSHIAWLLNGFVKWSYYSTWRFSSFDTWGPTSEGQLHEKAEMQCHLSFSPQVLSIEVVWLSLWINQQMTHHCGGLDTFWTCSFLFAIHSVPLSLSWNINNHHDCELCWRQWSSLIKNKVFLSNTCRSFSHLYSNLTLVRLIFYSILFSYLK